jgi:hypothetical protein
MTDCKYCEKTLPDGDEDMYLNHLVDNHKNELTPIDERKIKTHDSIDLNPSATPKEMLIQTGIILGIIAVIIATGYVIL